MIFGFFVFPLIGALIADKFGHKLMDLTILMLFSGAFLLTVTLTGILPHAVEDSNSFIWLFVGLGYVLQMIMDVFTKGVEHGHVHGNSEIKVVPLFIALFIHAFLEGMPLAFLASKNVTLINYFVGLAMHELPAAFILAYLLKKNTTNFSLRWSLLLLYSLAIPLGYLMGNTIKGFGFYNDGLKNYILAICSGILLHIATTVISENFKHHSFNKKKWFAFSLGLLVALISLFSHRLIH
jgi:zinc transporter ZupT